MLKPVKSLISALPFPVILRLYYLRARAEYWPLFERCRERANVPGLEDVDLSQYKKSDTLFVLGAGPSINQISRRRWEAIEAADSVGFNFWPFHAFVPTYYFFESGPPDYHPEIGRRLLQLFERRAQEYSSVVKVVMDLSHHGPQFVYNLPAGWRKNLYAACNVPVIARSSDEFRYVLHYWKRRELFVPGTRVRYLMKFCATLSTLVTFGAKLGYRRIVLCGVDLKTQDYFYQDAELYPESASFVPVAREQKHETLLPAAWIVPIDEVLLALQSELLEPQGIELYVEHPGSLLCPRFPAAPDALFEEAIASQPQARTVGMERG